MQQKEINQLAQLIGRLKKIKSIENFLINILTPAEIREIIRRIEIINMLKQGFSQREVAKKLHISITTVSRGARVISYGKPGIEALIANWRKHCITQRSS